MSVKTATATPSRTELSAENTGLGSTPAALGEAPAVTGGHNMSLLAEDKSCMSKHTSVLYICSSYIPIGGQVVVSQNDTAASPLSPSTSVRSG